jgi:hypothetical protein
MQAFFIQCCHFKTYILPKRWLLLVCDAVCTGNCVPTYRATKYKAPLKRRKFKPLLPIFICHDDGSSAISWNVGTFLSDYRASHFVRLQNFVAISSITPDLTKLCISCWHLSTQHIYLYNIFIDTTYLSIQHIYRYNIFIDTTYLSIQHIYRYNIFIDTTHLSIQHIYRYNIFIDTTYLSIQHIYRHNIFIDTTYLWNFLTQKEKWLFKRGVTICLTGESR